MFSPKKTVRQASMVNVTNGADVHVRLGAGVNLAKSALAYSTESTIAAKRVRWGKICLRPWVLKCGLWVGPTRLGEPPALSFLRGDLPRAAPVGFEVAVSSP